MDPLPILFLESEMVFEGGRKTKAGKQEERERERETWIQQFSGDLEFLEFLISLWPISKNLQQTHQSQLINVTRRQ